VGIIVAVGGSPLDKIAMVQGRTEAGLFRVTHMRRAGSVTEALADVPAVVPRGMPHPQVLVEGSDYVGGPMLAAAVMELSGKPVTDPLGRPLRRTWWVTPVQTVPADRLGEPAAWRYDVPRRDVIAAFVGQLSKGLVKAPQDDPLAKRLAAGVESLRAKRETANEERINEHEDLALALALCSWWAGLTRSAR